MKSNNRMGEIRLNSGFTLIELLIVVAIMAILAAIAVPNFLEAQVRSKVSRVKADQRTIATAIESYRVDNSGYPESGGGNDNQNYKAYRHLTTPIAYITSIPKDPFAKAPDAKIGKTLFTYYCFDINSTRTDEQKACRNGYAWALKGNGPEGTVGGSLRSILANEGLAKVIYDPTNGTISQGILIRTSRGIATASK